MSEDNNDPFYRMEQELSRYNQALKECKHPSPHLWSEDGAVCSVCIKPVINPKPLKYVPDEKWRENSQLVIANLRERIKLLKEEVDFYKDKADKAILFRLGIS